MKQDCQISTLSCSAQIALFRGTMTVQKKCKLCSGLLTQPFLCLRFNSFNLFSNQSCTDNDEDRPYTADSTRQDTESEPNKYFEVWNLSELWEKSLSSACFDDPYRDISIYTQCNEEQERERETFQLSLESSSSTQTNKYVMAMSMSTLLMFEIIKNISGDLDLHTMQCGAGERERETLQTPNHHHRPPTLTLANVKLTNDKCQLY